MFLCKRINGEIVECNIRREYTLLMNYTRSYREFECDCDYEYAHHDEFNGFCDYYVEYQSLAVKFKVFGEERIESFNNITLHSRYRISDRIVLIYNVFDKTCKIKG